MISYDLKNIAKLALFEQNQISSDLFGEKLFNLATQNTEMSIFEIPKICQLTSPLKRAKHFFFVLSYENIVQ